MKKLLIGIFLAVTLILYRFYFNSIDGNLSIFKGTELSEAYTVKIGNAINDVQRKKAEQIIKTSFQTIHSINSEISILNQLSAYAAVSISEDLERLLVLIDKIYFLTKGIFDPTIDPAFNRWKEILQRKNPITEEEAEAIKASIGWQKIHFRGRVFYKEHKSLKIDIGGIIKGYLIDNLSQNLQDEGFQNIYLEWDNVVKAQGNNEGEPWKVSIVGNEYEIDNKTFAKSKEDQTWKVQDCKTDAFCYILNPTLWQPIERTKNSICLTIVKLANSTIAEGIAKSLIYTENKEDALKLAESIKTELQEGQYWIFSCD